MNTQKNFNMQWTLPLMDTSWSTKQEQKRSSSTNGTPDSSECDTSMQFHQHHQHLTPCLHQSHSPPPLNPGHSRGLFLHEKQWIFLLFHHSFSYWFISPVANHSSGCIYSNFLLPEFLAFKIFFHLNRLINHFRTQSAGAFDDRLTHFGQLSYYLNNLSMVQA